MENNAMIFVPLPHLCHTGRKRDARRPLPAVRGLLAPCFLAACLVVLLLPGCGPKVIKQTVAVPGKRPPADAAVPPTQRPYSINGKTYYPIPSSQGYTETGTASWYGPDFHGRNTSCGEVYNMYDWTAAHKTLPMHTTLLVENLENGMEAVVRVNDRGPFARGRVIDVSYNAARQLGLIKNGTARVRITALGEAVTYQDGVRTAARFLPHQDFNRGDFYIQIGAFTDRANAERVKARLGDRGKEVTTLRYENGGQPFYRVQVKGGSTMAEARETERALAAAGFPEAFIVAR